ncbi:MAG: zinc-dependent metalloprotease [Saprospiraceae bacterium]|nr:zinc-dependent metalloprotease [Saprospiraceae bacterium]
MANRLLLLFTLLFFSFSALPIHAQEGDAKKDAKTDEKKPASASKLKPFSEIITAEAVSDPGLFTVHKVGAKYYFEIPNTLLEREILVVSRISGYVRNLNFGGAGMNSRPQQVIRWQRHDETILLRSVSYNSVASENLPIYESVRNNNFEPIIMAFDMACHNADSSGVVFEVTSLFTSDVEMIGPLSQQERKDYEIKGIDNKRCLVTSIKSFPENVEVRHVLTFNGSKLPDNQVTGALSIEMNQSFILLPAQPMQPRYYDARVGYFSVQQTDYGLDEQRAATRRFITRWRLEPSDEAAYRRGELVTPKKQIVYYIDPATPEKWRPYLKQGVEDWQKAFEAVGFKNAIIAKDPPSKTEDPDWSPEDVRYSVIRYISTDIQNAVGPHVHDPRTGEILESDILWYHNVMNLLRNWYFVQTAAINPKAQRVKFDDAVMGQLIRFVAAHEVGHTLGLPHNMGASTAYPVDSLRSPTFTARMGTAPSIMDYARFNYIAQPGDGDVALMPQIGPYDIWSITYGYKYFPGLNSADTERPLLHQMVKEKTGNPLYRYGRQHSPVVDPSAQTEDLGDNSVLASRYGLANLKRIVPNLMTWTAEEGKDYEQLRELYGQVIGQFNRYLGHVTGNVGGVYEFRKTADEAGAVYSPTPRDRQAEAVAFLNENLFETPTWLLDQNILSRIQESGIVDRIKNLQTQTLQQLFDDQRLQRLIEAQSANGSQAYSMQTLLEETRKGIWKELSTGKATDAYRRNLQSAHLDKLVEMAFPKAGSNAHVDIEATAFANLKLLEKELRQGIGKQKDEVSRRHFQAALDKLNRAIDSDD